MKNIPFYSLILLFLIHSVNTYSQGNSCNNIAIPNCLKYGQGIPYFRTFENSTCWKSESSIINLEALDLFFINDTTGFLLSSSKVYQYDNNKKIFLTIQSLPITLNNESRIRFYDKNNGYIYGYINNRLTVLKTVDAGKNWSQIVTINVDSQSKMEIEIAGIDEMVLTLVAESKLVHIKGSNSTIYNVSFSGTERLLKSFVSKGNILICSNKKIYKSTLNNFNPTALNVINIPGNASMEILDADKFQENSYVFMSKKLVILNDVFQIVNQINYKFDSEVNSGKFRYLSPNMYMMGYGMSIDGGCSFNNFSFQDFNNIYTFNNNKAIAFDTKNVYRFVCDINNRPLDFPIFSQNIQLPDNDQILEYKVNNSFSSNNSNFKFEPPSCWITKYAINKKCYFYFKGDGKRYKLSLEGIEGTQVTLLTGDILCLSSVNCGEINAFNKKIDITFNTIKNNEYYILFNQNYTSNNLPFKLSLDKSVNTYVARDNKSILFKGDILNSEYQGISKLEIYDITGRHIYTCQFNQIINTSSFNIPHGIYIFKLHQKGIVYVFKKLIN